MSYNPVLRRKNKHTHIDSQRQYLTGGVEDMIPTIGGKQTTTFHNKMFTDAFDNNWLDALAIYLMLFRRYDNKQITFLNEQKNKQLQSIATDLGVSKNTLISKIKILKEKGIIKSIDIKIGRTIIGNRLYLISNEEICTKYKCRKFGLYVNLNNVNTYKKLKYFLKNIPFLSNLSVQKNRCQQHSYFSTLRQKVKNNEVIEYSEYKALMKYERSLERISKAKVKNKGVAPNLSLKGIARVTGRKSSTTAFRYKNVLVDTKVIACHRRTKKLCDVESKEHFEYLKHTAKKIPKHAIMSVNHKLAYVYEPSLFYITTDKWSMEKMDEHYYTNLNQYVENKISNENAFKDILRTAVWINDGRINSDDCKRMINTHGKHSLDAAKKVSEMLKKGYSFDTIVYNSKITYLNTTREGRDMHNFTLTKHYEFEGLITGGVRLHSSNGLLSVGES
jgi:DNA-binding Lrp family transcriptional regulator